MPFIQTFLLSILLCCVSNVWAANVKELYESAVDAFNSQQFDASIDYYKQIIDQYPTFAPAYNGIGLVLKTQGDDDEEAIRYFQKAIKTDPRFVQAYENLGRMYYAKQDFGQAQIQFEKALAIDPQLTGAMVNLGWIHLLAKANPGRATKHFKSAYELDKNPNIYFALGMSYFSDNNRVAAMEVVTTLRSMKEDGLANQLETAMRENHRVNLNPNPGQQTPPVSPLSTPETPRSTPPSNPNPSPNEVKVRLSGKLDEIN